VNLFLRVLAREANGYHQLETLFCRLDLADSVVVRTGVRGRSLDCAGDVIPADGLGPIERNLAWRAAEAFAATSGWPNDWSIEITKRIPVGGGLGGGSSDAGAVLRCLNALAPAPIAERELLRIAASLGADVPFLTLDAPLALGWGRGERLLTLPPLPSRDVALVCFPFGVSTHDAYAWIDEEPIQSSPDAIALRLADLSTWDGVARAAHNDFESVVAPRFPDIASGLAELRALAAATGDPNAIAMLAGSGATLFVLSERLSAHDVRVDGGSSRIVRTRTASRVVDVELSD
jgi:4-diphosphocytidyl-2-C-methyl-D-erythritol kinase